MIGAALTARPTSLVFLLMALPAAGAQTPAAAPPRPRLVLALSGGGARGIAHIGVLRALEENGITVDAVAGTSMGALVGALYASGHKARALRTIVSSFDWEKVFAGRAERRLAPAARRLDEEEASALSLGLEPWRVLLPPSALSDYSLDRFLIRHLAGPGYEAAEDFDRLPIPFRAVAARLDNAERVVLAGGDLARAVRASVSIPVILPPVEWEGRLLIDGGVADNLPVGVARALGDVVLAVDVTSPPLDPREWRTLTGVGAQVSDALIEAQNRAYREVPDFQIRPDLGRRRATEYVDLDGLIESGHAAALAIVGPLKDRLGLRDPPPPAPAGRSLKGTPVVEVTVRGNRKITEEHVRRIFHIPPGRPLDLEGGLAALDRLFASRLFDSCWMGLEPAPEGGLRIVLDVTESARGSLGLTAGYDEPAKAHARVRAREQNALGLGDRLEALGEVGDDLTEVRLGSDADRLFGTPLGYSVRAGWREERPRLFADGVLLNRARFDRREALLSLTDTVGGAEILQAGIVLGTVETKARPAIPYPPRQDDTRTLFVRGLHDTLDDFLFPSRGWRLDLRLARSSPGLGASRDFWEGELTTRLALPAGSRVTLEAELFGGLSGRDLPVYDWFRLGGPLLVPGLHSDQLWGPQAGGASGAVGMRWGDFRLRARGGAGGAWPTRHQIRLSSLRLGVGLEVVYPTRFGPVGVDWGTTTDGRSLWSFTLGYP